MKFFICVMGFLYAQNVFSQNVGIGTTTPLARLHVADSGVLFTGPNFLPTSTTFNPPLSGAGTRMMWYPQKAAFRVGNVDFNQWDKDNIGNYSLASGYNTYAIGLGSTSLGYTSIAQGDYSVSLGKGSRASGEASISMGLGTTATGSSSISLGVGTIASGAFSTSMGGITSAIGYMSTSMGNQTQAIGEQSTSLGFFSKAVGNTATSMGFGTLANGPYTTSSGFQTRADGDVSTAMGQLTIAKSPNSLVLGLFNDTLSSNRLFEIGNGTANNARRNALTVLNSGNVGIGTTSPLGLLEVIGAQSASPVKLVIGNRGGFGPSALEFVSDYGTTSQWRPGYIRSNDQGNFTGTLEFFTNGTASTNLNFNVKGFEVRNGAALTATGTVGSYSDARLKNNIIPFTDGLNVINKINPVQFYFNEDAPFKTNQLQTGIVAQELEKIAPYMVEKTKQNGFEDLRTVNNQAYTFLLINAIKEQEKRIQALELKVDQLLQKK